MKRFSESWPQRRQMNRLQVVLSVPCSLLSSGLSISDGIDHVRSLRFRHWPISGRSPISIADIRNGQSFTQSAAVFIFGHVAVTQPSEHGTGNVIMFTISMSYLHSEPLLSGWTASNSCLTPKRKTSGAHGTPLCFNAKIEYVTFQSGIGVDTISISFAV